MFTLKGSSGTVYDFSFEEERWVARCRSDTDIVFDTLDFGFVELSELDLKAFEMSLIRGTKEFKEFCKWYRRELALHLL